MGELAIATDGFAEDVVVVFCTCSSTRRFLTFRRSLAASASRLVRFIEDLEPEDDMTRKFRGEDDIKDEDGRLQLELEAPSKRLLSSRDNGVDVVVCRCGLMFSLFPVDWSTLEGSLEGSIDENIGVGSVVGSVAFMSDVGESDLGCEDAFDCINAFKNCIRAGLF